MHTFREQFEPEDTRSLEKEEGKQKESLTEKTWNALYAVNQELKRLYSLEANVSQTPKVEVIEEEKITRLESELGEFISEESRKMFYKDTGISPAELAVQERIEHLERKRQEIRTFLVHDYVDRLIVDDERLSPNSTVVEESVQSILRSLEEAQAKGLLVNPDMGMNLMAAYQAFTAKAVEIYIQGIEHYYFGNADFSLFNRGAILYSLRAKESWEASSTQKEKDQLDGTLLDASIKKIKKSVDEYLNGSSDGVYIEDQKEVADFFTHISRVIKEGSLTGQTIVDVMKARYWKKHDMSIHEFDELAHQVNTELKKPEPEKNFTKIQMMIFKRIQPYFPEKNITDKVKSDMKKQMFDI